jgi:hypothetical protein
VVVSLDSDAVCSIGWGWGREDSPSSHDNNILYNYVFNSNWLLYDGGSYYTLGPQPNSVMAYNFANQQAKLFGSLYHDEVRWKYVDTAV